MSESVPPLIPDVPPPVVAPVPLFVAGTRGLCPRCGKPTVYAGLIKFADRCSACGLDFTEINVDDGPAAFLTLIIGAVVVGAAVVLQVSYDPPVWLQMLIWVPVTAAAVVACLRVAKGVLLTVEYRQAAHQGKIKS
ncbi:DUF983 domain-containing protein [uncultured Sphingomonas sp.]|uniref:DUF983 domain-containing protein n=1 Tax=uncultured Sphingomonas sp. TaxID=158754 RepID=UPI0035C9AFF3